MSSFVVAVDWHGKQSPRERLAAALGPLERSGAKTRTLADGNWCSIAEASWLAADNAACHVSDEIILLLDGYIIEGPTSAAELAAQYRRAGLDTLERLDGSFVIFVIDPKGRRGVAITDRAGSRPLFAAWNDAGLLLASELKSFRADASLHGEIDPAALPSMLLNSYFFDEMTYWRGVRAVSSARRVEFDVKATRVTRYWTPAFGRQTPPSNSDVANAVEAAIRGHVRPFAKPAIALSGGVDSRLMLAAARRAGLKLPTITWSYLDEDTPESDMGTARVVAEKCGVPQEQHRLSWSTLAGEAAALVEASDGLVGHLGGFADRRRLGDELALHYDAVLFGDECYRGEGAVGSVDEAVEGIGVQTLRSGAALRLARFFLSRDAAEPAIAEYRERLNQLLSDVDSGLAPQDLHDRLYWQVRLPRLLTGPKALWRRRLDAVSPLLSARLIEVAAATPPVRRVKKESLRACVREIAPDLDAVPYATRSGRVKWRRVLGEAGPFQKYLVETLLDPFPEFDRWFDRKSIELACRAALAEAPTRAVAHGDLFSNLRRRASSWLVRPLLRPPLLLGLLTIKLWMAANR